MGQVKRGVIQLQMEVRK